MKKGQASGLPFLPYSASYRFSQLPGKLIENEGWASDGYGWAVAVPVAVAEARAVAAAVALEAAVALDAAVVALEVAATVALEVAALVAEAAAPVPEQFSAASVGAPAGT